MKTNIELSLTYGSDDRWMLRATDALSRVLILQANFHPEKFSDLMHTAPTVVEAELYVDAAERWGKNMEVEKYLFEVPDRNLFKEAEAAAAERCAAEGWTMDREFGDRYNHHRLRDTTYQTYRRRWVARDEA